MRARAALLLLATTCIDEGDRFSPIVVDIAANCAEAEITVLLREMEDGARPWRRVIAVAVDAPGLDRYWVFAEMDDPNNPAVPRHALVHVDGNQASNPQYITPDTTLGDESYALRAGPVPGSVWLVQRSATTFRLWHLDAAYLPGPPLIAGSDELGDWPQNVIDLCADEEQRELWPCEAEDWHRELVFLDGYAHVAMVPSFSSDNFTRVIVGRLDPYLYFDDTKPLEFDRQCDPTEPLPEYTECTEENAATSYPAIDVMGSQLGSNTPEHRMFMLRQRAIDGVARPREVVFLTLKLQDGTAAGDVRSKVLEELEPTVDPPSGLARDDFSSYMLHSARPLDEPDTEPTPVVTRLSELDKEFTVLEGLAIPEDSTLLQLESDIALGRIVDGTWEVTKLFPDAPERSRVTTYEGSAPIVRVSPAGHGAFLLFKEAGGPDLGQLQCPDESEADGESDSGD